MSAASQEFRIGPLSFRYDEATGMVRTIRFHGHEVLNGIYPAVRDSAWGTVSPAITPVVVTASETQVRLRLGAEVKAPGIEVAWQAEITAEASGRLDYVWRARAQSETLTNRTGLCVLHPADAAGAPCTIEHTDGVRTKSHLPQAISPHQPFKDIRAITHRFAPAAEATVRLEGEVFEMEDQRNWTDASFKTYCRPLDWPRPYRLRQDEEVNHRVTLTVSGPPPGPLPDQPRALALETDGEGAQLLPPLGFALAAPITPAVLARLTALRPDHVRVEGNADTTDQVLAWAGPTAASLNCALHVALRGATRPSLPPARLSGRTTFLLFGPDGNLAPPEVIAAWQQAGFEAVGTGTLHHFTELNRQRPSADGPHRAVTFGINAQVHAFDDTSLFETTTQHRAVAENAAIIAAGREVIVGPIVLGPTPDSTDRRLQTAIGAAWTLGSLVHLCRARNRHLSATYFRVGGTGDFLGEGAPTPIELLFLALAGATQAEVISLPQVTALLVRTATGRRLLVSPTGDAPCTITIPFSGLAGPLEGPLQPFTRGRVSLPARCVWQLDLAA